MKKVELSGFHFKFCEREKRQNQKRSSMQRLDVGILLNLCESVLYRYCSIFQVLQSSFVYDILDVVNEESLQFDYVSAFSLEYVVFQD